MKTLTCLMFLTLSAVAEEGVDWKRLPPDLTLPEVRSGEPAPGQRVKQTSVGWEGTQVHHLLHLPQDWQPGKRYPVLIEYAGNGPYADARGDTCDGTVESCQLGYGISAGRGFIWACLPYIERTEGQLRNAAKWWGEVAESKRYAVETVRDLCQRYGGDPQRVLLCGFSRGSIGCHYLGLHDEEIAALWCGFVCHSHFDGVREGWPYASADRASALTRLRRLGTRPEWISHESSTMATESWLRSTGVPGRWTFVAMPFPNHSSAWVLRDLPERRQLRDWVRQVLKEVP